MLPGVTYIAATAEAARNVLVRSRAQLLYIIDKDSWAVAAVGQALTQHLESHLPTRLTTTALGARNKIVHFGSIDMYITASGWRRVHPSNQIVVTVFHLSPVYRQNHLLAPAVQNAIVHTTNTLTKEQLIVFGVPAETIRVIPLGVDGQLFKPAPEIRQVARRKLGIREQAFVVGSFQKDGVGWGAGDQPKLIKGPDILVSAIERLATRCPVHVLLAGPARGYVKRRLNELGLPYTDAGYQADHASLASLYHALDAYLVPARVEGGPLALLEAWAAGVPVVTTPVGMVRDIARDEVNCLVAPPEDAASLASALYRLYTDSALRRRLASRARQDAATFSWQEIANRYLRELYQPLLARP